MILSDREMRAVLARGAVGIQPEPPPSAWSSTAVDLTLAEQISVWQPPGGKRKKTICRPHSPTYDYAALAREWAREALLGDEGHIMEPYSFVLGWTAERLRLPHAARLAARVEGKSSLARLGLGVHVTAPTIHSGFGAIDDPTHPGNPIRLEIWNIGPLRIKLEIGMPICQLIFEWVDGTPEKGYAGRFRLQGPELK